MAHRKGQISDWKERLKVSQPVVWQRSMKRAQNGAKMPSQLGNNNGLAVVPPRLGRARL